MSYETEKLKEKDFLYNRVSTSRFIFYVTVFSVIASSVGSCYKLYQERYKGKPDVEIQSSSQYNPQYK
ncbi:MAG: hypothetical protein ACR2FN_15125 [Chitinophagaceae bacterium]